MATTSACFLSLTTSDWLNIAEILVLSITAIILAITAYYVREYTKSTNELKNVAIKQIIQLKNQTDLKRLEIGLEQKRHFDSIKPTFLFFDMQNTGDGHRLTVKNTGKGPAKNIKFWDAEGKYKFFINPSDRIAANDRGTLNIKGKIDAESKIAFIVEYLNDAGDQGWAEFLYDVKFNKVELKDEIEYS